MKTILPAVVAGLLATGVLSAAVEVTAPVGMDINWVYESGPEIAGYHILPYGYLKDYNGDGAPDYLIHEDIEANGATRLWAMNATATGGTKTYAADRVAGRDFEIELGIFVPDQIRLIHPQGTCDIDAVVQGDNRATEDGEFTQLIFKRLNLDDPDFPDAEEFTIAVQSEYWPSMNWSADFTADGYPDIILSNTQPNASNQFVVGCFNGKDGTLVWSRPLDLDPRDPGASIIGPPQLQVSVLPMQGGSRGTGDFDGDDKPELFLDYHYGYTPPGEMFGTRSMIRVLDGNGNFFSGYAADWVEFADMPGNIYPPVSTGQVDYNGDGKVDLFTHVYDFGMGQPSPPFMGYDLITKQQLFQADPSEFDAFEDNLNAMIFDVYRTDYSLGDVDGDGFNDLSVHAMTPDSTGNVALAIFRAYASNPTLRGRLMTLNPFPGNEVTWWANDFDGNGILDFLVTGHPQTPGASTVDISLTTTQITPSAILPLNTAPLQFPHQFVGAVSPDDFDVLSGMGFPMQDLDSDGSVDTFLSVSYSHSGTGVANPLSYGQAVFFDNAPSGQPFDVTARLQIKSESEQMLAPTYQTATLIGHQSVGCLTYVDQNGDGFRNDGIVSAHHVIVATSFQYGDPGGGETTIGDIVGYVAGRMTLTPGKLSEVDLNADGVCDVADVVRKATTRR